MSADVLLVQMPFARLALPSIGLGLVSAALTRSGVSNRVRYENLRFAEQVGLGVYSTCEGVLGAHPVSEWAFARAAFPDHRPDPAPLFAEAAARLPFGGQLVALEFDSLEAMFLALRGRAESFLDQLVEEILAEEPRVVGCTSMFTQHVPSLALLRRIKERAPGVATVLGGACCAENMGRVTHRRFDWVDYVFLGEADDTVGFVFGELVAGRAEGLEGRPEMSGVLAPFDRRVPGAAAAKRGHAVPEMGSSPVPDYSGFQAALGASALAADISPGLLMEFSRGCWWAENRRCTFCGIEKFSQRQRNKQAAQVTSEIRELIARHGIDRITVVDNAVEPKLLRAVFAELATWERPPRMFLETRPEVSREDFELLASGGCAWVQTGVESLDDDSLREMHKGTSAARNLQLLKWGEETGVQVQWNWITELPGETEERYQRAAALIPLLVHLQGPRNVGPLIFVRHATYFEEPGRWGLSLEPEPIYRQLYPFSEEEAREFAYLMRRRGAPPLAPRRTEARRRFHEEMDRWMFLSRSSRPPKLLARDDGRQLELEDTRPIAPARQLALVGRAREVCLALLEAPATDQQLADRLGGPGGAELELAVEDLEARKLLARVGKWWVGLPVRPPARGKARDADSPMGYVESGKRLRGPDATR